MIPRKFLNQDEELLAELRPHWIFLFGPLFTSLATWVVIVVILVLWHSAPGWTNYPFLILALIPGLWLLGRYVRWRSYIIALTSTRILVRQGIFGRDTVQLRLQRIVEVNLRQAFIERILQCGTLLIDVQGEDNTLTLEYVRKPAVVQRVINSQINEIVGGGEREPIPEDMLPFDQRSRGRNRAEDTDEMEAPHTPPFGQSAVTDPVDQDATDPGRTPLTRPLTTPPVMTPVMTQTPAGEPPATPPTAGARPTEQPAPATDHFDVRDRLIQLDDLRRRGIISEEEFAAKKTELLNRI
jgi:membrane protein YdbS with pleckstrin-like domain